MENRILLDPPNNFCSFEMRRNVYGLLPSTVGARSC